MVRTVGNALLLSGIAFTFLLFWPFLKEELRYDKDQIIQKTIAGEFPKSGFGALIKQGPPLLVEPVDKEFGIVIEKIGVNAPVVPEINPADYNEYIAALKKGAAHAAGTAFPGSKNQENNNVFIFAHSTLNLWDVPKYNAIFILLRKLEVGDRVSTLYQGQRYDYEIFDKKIVEANDVRYLTSSSQEPILTLQTCDPPGTQLRRLIITAKLIEF